MSFKRITVLAAVVLLCAFPAFSHELTIKAENEAMKEGEPFPATVQSSHKFIVPEEVEELSRVKAGIIEDGKLVEAKLTGNEPGFRQVVMGNGVNAIVPQKISATPSQDVRMMFRPRAVYKKAQIVASIGDTVLYTKKAKILAPGEMVNFTLSKDSLSSADVNEPLNVMIKEAA